MNQFEKVSLFILRVSLGWLMFWAGYSHITDPNFAASISGYLGHAQLLTGFYSSLTGPGVLPVIVFLNAWGLTLLGISLISGAFIRFSAPLGILLMILYYLPLGFPHPDLHSFIVDDHIIYSAALLVIWAYGAGRAWGLGERFR